MKSAEDSAGAWGALSFSWLTALVAQARGRPLAHADLPPFSPPAAARCAAAEPKLWEAWEAEMRRAREASDGAPPSFLAAALRTVRGEAATSGAFFALHTASQLAAPLTLKRLIDYLGDASLPGSETSPATGFGLAAALVAVVVVGHLGEVHGTHLTARFLFRLRAASVSAVFRKSTRLPLAGGGHAGTAVNLVSNDCQRVLEYPAGFHNAWSAPLVIVVGLGLLYAEVGASALATLATLLAFLPLVGVLTAVMNTAQQAAHTETDARVNLLGNVLDGMQTVKLQAWESPVAAAVRRLRAAELVLLSRFARTKAASGATFMEAPFCATLVTFLVFVGSGGSLTTAKAFTVIALINAIRFPFTFLPLAVNYWLQTVVSSRRIQEYLLRPEVSPAGGADAADGGKAPDGEDHGAGAPAVRLTGASFAWAAPGTAPRSCPAPTLVDVTTEARPGELVCVVGRVGSGKSTLLLSLLGETALVAGSSSVRGGVAYVPQRAFVINATLRDNVTMGLPWRADAYARVLADCGLEKDVADLAFGDATELGEGGSNLSGGQRARVNLARAAYDDSPGVVVMDSPLAAVDARLAAEIFSRCVLGLMRGRTRVMSTSSAAMAAQADRVVVLDGGRVVEQGTPAELAARPGGKFAEMAAGLDILGRAKGDDDSDSDGDGPVTPTKQTGHAPLPRSLSRKRSHVRSPSSLSSLSLSALLPQSPVEEGSSSAAPAAASESSNSVTNLLGELNEAAPAATLADAPAPARSGCAETAAGALTVSAEERALGGHTWKTFRPYFALAGTWLSWASLGAAFLFVQGTDVWGTWWIGYWAQRLDGGVSDTGPGQAEFMGVYAATFTAACAALAARSWLVVRCGLRASDTLHDRMLVAVLGRTAHFFESTPRGRVLNRFGRDLYELDVTLPLLLENTAASYTAVVAVLVVVGIVAPVVLAAVVPAVVVFRAVQVGYSHASRDLQRLEAVSRSPLVAHVSETMSGLASVRALGAEHAFVDASREHADVHQAALYLTVAADSWLTLRLGLLASVLLAAVAAAAVASIGYGGRVAGVIQWGGVPSAAGSDAVVSLWSMVLTYALLFSYYLRWSVQMATQAEAKLNSVQRVLEYCETGGEHAEDASPTTAPELADAARAAAQDAGAGPGPAETDGPRMEGVTVVGLPSAAHADGHDPGAWPWRGEIVFEDVSLRYRANLPLALRGVSLRVPAGARVALVGRTGSSKSTLLRCLFRLTEPCGGRVTIDGVDTSRVSLARLRGALCVVSQDAAVFSGTLRDNLDPLGARPDADLLEALDAVGLGGLAASVPGGLRGAVRAEALALSSGQRQLLCLARAILRRPRVLCLDEATSATDGATDARVQAMIRERFAGATVITVAHRIGTVLDYDLAVVMRDGCVAEVGAPSDLLADPASAFSALASFDGHQQ